MKQAAEDLKHELGRSAMLLRTLGDEVRVQIKLGGMEVKDEWRRLEPRLEAVLQQASRDASEATRTALDEVTEAVRKFRESLR
jgi:hypothetical protein